MSTGIKPSEALQEKPIPHLAPATCDLCDAHKGDSSGAFRVLPPVFRDFGARGAFHGLVSTVKCFEENSMEQVNALQAASFTASCFLPAFSSARGALGDVPQ